MRTRVTLLALLVLAATSAAAAPLPGTASLSGAVQASKPFQGAQVRMMNVDRNVLFMVYTSGGRYQTSRLPRCLDLVVCAADQRQRGAGICQLDLGRHARIAGAATARDEDSRDLEERRDGGDRHIDEDSVRTTLTGGHPLWEQRPGTVG